MTYLITYGIARFAVECYRRNLRYSAGIPTAQDFWVGLVAVGLIGLLVLKAKEREAGALLKPSPVA